MKYPKIDLEELEKQKQRNFEERLKFIEKYVEWLKKTDNITWSRQQKALIESSLKKKTKIE
ncbi:MAG: hypothetical protein ACTSW1_01800 [Candidatus Hodarchaeales archaeon]